MWMLLVMTTLSVDEVKVTQYDLYKTEKACVAELIELKKEFSEGEEAMCYFAEYLKPKKLHTVLSK